MQNIPLLNDLQFFIPTSPYEDEPGVSNSSLQFLPDGAAFKAAIDGGRNGTSTESQKLGTLVHTMLLEPEKLPKEVVSVPTGKMLATLEYYVAACKAEGIAPVPCVSTAHTTLVTAAIDVVEYKTATVAKVTAAIGTYARWLDAVAADQPVMTAAVQVKLTAIAAGVVANPVADRLLNEVSAGTFALNELPLVAIAPNLGTTVKCRVDRAIFDMTTRVLTIVDVKTTSSPPHAFHASAAVFDYPRQMLFYGTMLSQHLKRNGFTVGEIRYVYIVTETVAPYRVLVYQLMPTSVEAAAATLNAKLERAAWHLQQQSFDFPMEHHLTGGILPL